MIVGHIVEVTIVVILLFLAPIVVYAIKLKTLKSFSLATIVKTLNRAYAAQLLTGILLYISMWIIGYNLDSGYRENLVLEIFVGTAYTYCIVGMFFYSPALVLLNLLKWIIGKSFQ
jgi:hypothetical protein